MTKFLCSVLLLGVAPASLSAQPPPCHDLQAISAIQQDLLVAFPFTGSTVVQVRQRGVVKFEQAAGTFDLQTVVPIASATKTLSAAVLLSLVDSGLLSLDDPVGQYLPEWSLGPKAAITLRMCFTHTSGLPTGNPLISDDSVTLRQAAMQLANVSLLASPGSAFAYGGVSMHVAGAVCEVVGGASWAQLFQQRVATPLGMLATDYEAFGPTNNPRIAGGARSDMRDFAAFVDMLRRRGTHNGVQVLSPASVDLMLTDQTSSLPILSTPHPDSAPYGLGIWLERRDSLGRTLLAEAAGAFGFIGWVDRAHDASGVFLVRNSNQQTLPFVYRTWDACDDALLPDGLQCVGVGSPACAGGAWLNADRAARTGEVDFQLRAARAPANALGLLLLGDPLPAGLPLVDLLVFVGPAAAVLATLVSDADGRAVLPVPLVGVLPGVVIGLQAAWLTTDPCVAFGLQASHGLQLSVLP